MYKYVSSYLSKDHFIVFFFFQAEDGIRDFHVTGVQTCALPIFAKDLADFAKKAPALTLKGGIFEGTVLSGEQAKKLSTLESREVMLTKIAGMAVSPIQRAANAFAA